MRTTKKCKRPYAAEEANRQLHQTVVYQREVKAPRRQTWRVSTRRSQRSVPALHSLATSSPRHALAAATPGEDEFKQWRSDQEQQRQSRELQPLIAAAIQKELQPLLTMVGVPPSNLTPQPSPTTSTARAAAFTNSKLAASDSARRVPSI